MSTLNRLSPDAWPELGRNFTWASHLNDLRWLDHSNATDGGARLLAELKCLLLFHARNMILSDKDVLNCSVFHQLFSFNADGVRTAIQNGAIVAAYRDTVLDLSDLNRQQGDRRADKSMQDRSAVFTNAWDGFFEQSNIPVLDWKLANLATRFEAGIGHLLELKVLSDSESDKLRRMCLHARQMDDDGRLLFGNVWKAYVDTADVARSSDVVQAIRAVHLITPAKALSVDPSVAVEDVRPFLVRAVMGNKAIDPLGGIAFDRLIELLPKRILHPASMTKITFDQILRWQDMGVDLGYFSALDALRRGARTESQIGELLVAYLQKLSAYVGQIGRDGRVELWPWHEHVIRQYEQHAELRPLIGGLIGAVVPVALCVTDLGLTVMGVHPLGDPVLSLDSVDIVAGLGGALGSLMGFRSRNLSHAEISRALRSGSYTTNAA